MAIEAAILDFDGTLVDSIQAWRDLEGVLVQGAPVAVTPEDRALFTTLTLDETAAWFHDHLGLGEDAMAVRKIMDDYMVDYLSRSTQVLPGVEAFLEACAERGIALSVASSSPQLYLRTALEAAGLAPYFSAILSVEDLGVSKREPFIFDRACALMGASKETTWGFDDSIYALDVMREAGYPTVGIYDPHESLSFDAWKEHADIVVRSFEELTLDRFNEFEL